MSNNILELPVSNPDVHNSLLDGFHAIRNRDRVWPGFSADLIMEQVLIENMKSSGGLTKGRGNDDSSRLIGFSSNL